MSFPTPFQSLLRHRALAWELTKRDVLGRYRGASFGLVWSLASPFLLLCIYTFAFGTVMGGRWPQAQSGHSHYALILFAGLVVHGFFAECLTRSPGLVVGNPNFVKRVIFPLDLLPWPMVFSALFHMAMNVVVFLVLRWVMDGAFAWTTVLLPLVILPLVPFGLGLSWFIASFSVYFRDVQQVVGVASMAFLFLSSAMMPLDSVPASYRWVFAWNPLSLIIDEARKVLLWETLPDWTALGVYALAALVFMVLGHRWFVATQRGFADVL